MARAVRFDLVADASKFTRGMRDAQRSSQQFTDHTSRAGKALRTAFTAFSAGAVVLEMRNWVAAARDSNKVAAQTATVLKSTHNAAGLTAGQFAELAKSISKTSAVDDDLIQSGENIIATFTEIHGDVFKKTTQAAVDMTAAMNHGEVTQEGLQSSAIQLGKALNDPIKGLTALQRVGVTFSAQQKEQIADFVKHGQVAKAQGVILAEVNKEFGGSAAAAVTPAKQLAVTWGNMQEVLGNLLIPAIDRGATFLSNFLALIDRNKKVAVPLIEALAALAAGILAINAASKVLAATKAAWDVVSTGINAVTGAWTRYGAAKAAQTAVNEVLEGTEQGVAVATATSGVAATGATVSFAKLRAVLVTFVGPALAVAAVFSKLSESAKENTLWIDRHGSALDRVKDKQTGLGQVVLNWVGIGEKAKEQTKETSEATERHANVAGAAAAAIKGQALETAYNAKQQEAQRLEIVKTVPVMQTAAEKVKLNADRAKELSGKLAELRGQFAQARDSVAQTITSYDGLISKSKVTASEVIKDLHNQVANFRTYSSDVHRLIKAGVNPAAIQELSEKGPQYIHALASGSAKQLADYKATWAARNREVKGDFTRSMQAQLVDLAKKIRAMQREIDRLHGKNIPVSASLKLNFTKDYTRTEWVADRARADRMAEGGIVQGPGTGRSDSVRRWLSKGEYVVNADATKAYLPYLEWMNAKRMAAGGPVGRIDAQSRAVNKIEAFGTGTRLHAGIAAFLAAFGGMAGFPGGAASGSVIRLALAQAKRMAASFKVALALIEAGIVESGLRNLPYGDRDSLGFLQQRPSQGWLHPMNISYAAWDFLRRAIPIQGRYGTAGMLAQAVQRSAFPARYDAVQARALGILNAYGYDRGGLLPPGLSLAWNGTGRAEPVGGVDAGRLAAAVASALDGATVVMDGRKVGQLVTPHVRMGIRDVQRRSGVPPSQQLR